MRSVLLFVAVWGSVAVAATAQAADLPVKNRLTLTFFEMQDVGGGCGLAIAIQTPGGRTWLYDTGLSGSKGKPFDAGRDAIAPFLRQHSIQRIDGILISHPHSDHYGGLPWLLEHFTVDRLIDTGYPSELVYENIHKQFASDGGKLTGEVRAYENIRKRFVAGGGKYQAVLALTKYAEWSGDGARKWMPALCQAGVQLVVSGHKHAWRVDEPAPGQPMQVVGGGASRRETATVIVLEADAQSLHLVIHDAFSGDELAQRRLTRS